MSTRTAQLLERIGSTLNAIPGTFSTPQWGGRAYKVGAGGRGKLLAFVAATKERDAVTVSFKLERSRAEAVIDRYAWIDRHSFRTLGGSGWVTARIGRQQQLRTIEKLLIESRSLYPAVEAREAETRRQASRSADPVARHIDRVMGDAAAEGWRPDGEW